MLLNCDVGEDSWEPLGLQGDQGSQSSRISVLNIHWKDWCWSWSSSTLTTWWMNWLTGKDPDAEKDWRQEEKGLTEDEIVGWNHQLNGPTLSKLWVGDGQGSLVCCHPRGRKESDTTEWPEQNQCIISAIKTTSLIRNRVSSGSFQFCTILFCVYQFPISPMLTSYIQTRPTRPREKLTFLQVCNSRYHQQMSL